jgi:hypothetical protein
MARKDHTKETLEEGIEIGRENADLIPGIKNWCNHIVLKDESAGLLAEVYGLPTTIAVSCPHASGGSTGMKLDWIAGSFIIENCIGCQFHQPITEPNFGMKVLAEKQRRDEEERINQQRKEETHRQLKESIDAIVKLKKSRAHTTELSILRLAEELERNENKLVAANKLFESSKIDPGFFSPVCLEVLSVYFEDEEIGETCLKTVNEVFKIHQSFPDTIFQQAIRVLRTGKNFNGIALLIPYYTNGSNIKEHEETIHTLISCLSYTHFIGDPYDHPKDYASSIKALLHLISVDREYMHSLFQKLVLLEDSTTRINICGFLQDIMVDDSAFVMALVPELIRSFEYIDRAQYDSADLATAKTLGKLIKASPDAVYPDIKERISRLRNPGRDGAVRLYYFLLDDQEFSSKHQHFCQELIRELIGLAMSKTEPGFLHELYIDEVHQLRHGGIHLIEPHFDTLLGWLSKMIDDEKTFLWWREEIEKKKPEEWATFNPLRGKNFSELSSQHNRISREIHEIRDVIRDILKLYGAKHVDTVKSILTGLDSATQPKFKGTLISIVSNSISDSYLLSGFIPSLYNYLFDPHSVEVRDEAMKFLDRLAENNPALITQTLFDLTDIFLKDQQVAVRGIALEIQETLFLKVPERFNYANIDHIIKSMGDPYVYIHKKAARISETFFPVMRQEQKWATLIFLQQLLSIYKDKGDEFAKDCVKILLGISEEFPGVFKKTIQEDVIGYCQSNEYYDVKEFVEILREICRAHHEYEDEWLKIVIDLFQKIPPGFRSDMEWRAELYKDIHKLTYGCMLRNIVTIEKFLNSRKDSDKFDIVHMLHVLCYFEFHDKVISYVSGLPTKVQRVTATEGIFGYAELLNRFAEFEYGVSEGEFRTDNLKLIKDELQEPGS